MLRSGEVGSAGPYTGPILLSTESPNPPAPPYRGKLASKKKKKSKKETVKINEQGPLLDTPTRQEMTLGTKTVSTDLCQEPRCLCFLIPTYLSSIHRHIYLFLSSGSCFLLLCIRDTYEYRNWPCNVFPLNISRNRKFLIPV